jgi:hypothetical protein
VILVSVEIAGAPAVNDEQRYDGQEIGLPIAWVRKCGVDGEPHAVRK